MGKSDKLYSIKSNLKEEQDKELEAWLDDFSKNDEGKWRENRTKATNSEMLAEIKESEEIRKRLGFVPLF